MAKRNKKNNRSSFQRMKFNRSHDMGFLDRIFGSSGKRSLITKDIEGETFTIRMLTGYDIVAIGSMNPQDTCVYVLANGLIYNGEEIGMERARQIIDDDWKMAMKISFVILMETRGRYTSMLDNETA